MSTRGKAVATAIVCAASVVGTILLWPASHSAPAAPTSEQIKASAQARLDMSLEAGRTAREMIRATGQTPGDESCQAAWDNMLPEEQQDLRYAMWRQGCADDPTP
ncbi:hypothetical protein [Streptomyces sp. NPDC059787]|uniref:hypothetical protein n=1 Tax=Streptomyces sp. NPDC059787 TaxID=3346947 RepID=UPI00364B8913